MPTPIFTATHVYAVSLDELGVQERGTFAAPTRLTVAATVAAHPVVDCRNCPSLGTPARVSV